MGKRIVFALALGSAAAVSGGLFAGEIENSALGAEESFLEAVSAGSVQAVLAAAPEAPAVSAVVSEYRKLAAAVEFVGNIRLVTAESFRT